MGLDKVPQIVQTPGALSLAPFRWKPSWKVPCRIGDFMRWIPIARFGKLTEF